MKINWINSWAKGNKKETICELSARLGRITLFELYINLGIKYRLIVLNFGLEL
jgi:hypothetical protein